MNCAKSIPERPEDNDLDRPSRNRGRIMKCEPGRIFIYIYYRTYAHGEAYAYLTICPVVLDIKNNYQRFNIRFTGMGLDSRRIRH